MRHQEHCKSSQLLPDSKNQELFRHDFQTHWSTSRFCAQCLFTVCICRSCPEDVERKTVAITYPLDETVTVKFRGTTLLPRLKGEAKVKRAGRRGTRVELSVEDLPRASELGGIYTTYILWAISPDGHVDNLGEIKRSGSTFR